VLLSFKDTYSLVVHVGEIFGLAVNKVHTDLQSTTVLGFQILEKDYEDANVCE
jgi:hypothetical protein